MAFATIPSGKIDVGDPITKDLWDAVKDNFDDHESRVNALEGGANKIVVFDFLVFNAAQYVSASTLEGIAIWRSPASFTLTAAQISNLTAGTSGTIEYDVKKSTTLGGVFTTVFSTKPSVAFGAGNDATSTNAVFSTTAVAQGDWLQLDISSFQSPQRRFHVLFYGEVS